MKKTLDIRSLASIALLALAGLALAQPAAAAGAHRGGGGGGGGAHHAQAGGGGARHAQAGGGAKAAPRVNNSHADVRSNNVRNTSVNNVNVNKNVNVNVEGNNGCCNNGWDDDYHPIARAAAVTATVAVTAAVIGSIVNTPPPGCVPVNYGGFVYQQCGSTWYQPQGAQFVVVNPPY